LKYHLFYHPSCLKRFKRIPVVDQKRVLVKLDKLANNPFSSGLDIKKLVKTKNSFRLRVGNLRAIYELDMKKKVIYVWEIDYRGKVY